MADTNVADIGKYHIIELLGSGAMGVVYKAQDSVLDRTVAIKVMNESIARQDDLRKRFLHEAQAAASLQHPNVVCIHDFGEVDGHLFIAMEFIQGVDLETLLELREPLSLQARLDIVIDVLTGLSFAHKRGIVHRDIKPANIRVTEDGRAKIMDFGVAHLASSNMTSTGAVLGTPSYMAPEAITEGKTSPATDIFAVGGVLYQLLTQMRPFEGPTLQNLLFRIVTEKPRPVRELVPGLPPALDRIVEKAMAKEPADRYSNALDMANDLTKVRSKLSGPSYPASVSLSASVDTALEHARKRSRTRTRNFAVAGVGGVAVVAVVILIGWSQLVESRSTNSPVADKPAAGATIPSGTPPLASLSLSARPEKSRSSTRNTSPVSPPSVTTKTARSEATSAPITQVAVRNSEVQQRALISQPPPVAAPPSVQTQPQEAPAPAPTPATEADITPTVEAYATAIESRDIGTVRRVYPGLTAGQQRAFEQFFQSARNITVTFRVANVEGTSASADARLIGRYDYVNSEGRTERQPVSIVATLRRDGTGWRLLSVR